MTSPFLSAEERSIFEDLRNASVWIQTLGASTTEGVKALSYIESARAKLVEYIVETRAKLAGV